MAEEVVDPKPIIEEECSQSHHCLQTSEKLKSCTARVEGGATEECVEEFFDFMECVDHCVAGKLFSKLK